MPVLAVTNRVSLEAATPDLLILMPISPENAKRYPANWQEIVELVRERSGDCCEGSPAYMDCRAANGKPHPITGSQVVLTTGHLDHMPENCSIEDLSNLKHWCQRCHLTYDAKHHAQTAYMTRRCKGTEEMFE